MKNDTHTILIRLRREDVQSLTAKNIAISPFVRNIVQKAVEELDRQQATVKVEELNIGI